ncbi:MAG: Crp/Fnr family transcriptional regulator [Pseudolabrys sp.]
MPSLARIASIIRFRRGEKIYSDGKPAEAIFNIVSGIVKTDKPAPSGGEHIAAFLYPQDLFGLSEQGRYTNSAKAITPVTAYALPVPALRRQLSKDAALDFHLIAKLSHALREAQRHALLLVGMSLAAASRGFRDLAAQRVIRLRDRRHVKITDRKAFEKLTRGTSGPGRARSK